MKKNLKIIIPLLFLGLLGYFGFKIISKINHKNEVAIHIKTIPNFLYKNVNGGTFGKVNLKPNTNTIFLYFNTDCEFCQEEAKQIKANLEQFKAIQLVFISIEKTATIKNFAINNKLNIYDNVHFLCDESMDFSSSFDVTSLPTLVLYDEKQQLIEKIKGEIKVESLLKKLRITN